MRFSSNPPAPPGQPLAATKARRPGPGTRTWLSLLAAALLLALVGAWTSHAVQVTVRENLTVALQTILQANIEALQVVVENERGHILAWARDAEVRTLTEELLSGADPARVRRQLGTVLGNVAAEEDYLGFAIVDAAGVIRATDQPVPYLGQSLSPAAMELLRPILSGETSFEKPFAKNALIAGDPEINSRPVLLAKAPIADATGRIIAALIFTIDPEKDFTRILSVAELGRSGSTFAFDARGVMLSESRHEGELKRLGLIPDRPGASAILTLALRDPGVDLARGEKPRQPPDAWPLTRMAASAVTGRPGIDVEGYRDCRGVWVVGAWQWLPQYGFGVATEVERSEALRSLRPVRLAFAGLFTLLAAAAAGVLLAGYILNRLRREIAELRELGQYTLVEKIGEGGMGKVYKARHALLRRPTAIKLIGGEQIDGETLERFEQEVQLTSQLTHPNTISVYDYGHSPDGVFYYAMEYLGGITLGELVRIERPIPAGRVVHILRQICGSLAEAHDQGLIHRDIKPGNVMLCQRGGEYDVVKVLDFGLVQEIAAGGAEEGRRQRGVMGTPGFIAPELLRAASPVDARSDIYSIGALAFLLLTGETVFSAPDVEALLRETLGTPPPRPSQRTAAPIPEALDRLVHACLSREPQGRPASAAVLAEALAAVEGGGGWTQAQARAWWQEHAERIRAERQLARPQGESEAQTALAIDLGERDGGDQR